MSTRATIDTVELEQRLDDGDIPYLWNVLTDDYFRGALIPGSSHVPLDRVGREARRLDLDDDAEIVVYCSSYACPMSADAARKLRGLGFRNVRDYEAGVAGWKEAGHPVEMASAPASAA